MKLGSFLTLSRAPYISVLKDIYWGSDDWKNISIAMTGVNTVEITVKGYKAKNRVVKIIKAELPSSTIETKSLDGHWQILIIGE